jgi:hypothetical protein
MKSLAIKPGRSIDDVYIIVFWSKNMVRFLLPWQEVVRVCFVFYRIPFVAHD